MPITSPHPLKSIIPVVAFLAIASPAYAFNLTEIDKFNCQSSGTIGLNGKPENGWFKFTHISIDEFKSAEADAKRMSKAVTREDGTYYWSTKIATVNGSVQKLVTRAVKLSGSPNGNTLITEMKSRWCDEKIERCHPQLLFDSDYVESIKILSPKGFVYGLSSFSYLDWDVIGDLRFKLALETVLKFDKAMQACHQ